MEKKFFDVFPTLKMKEQTQTLFADVEVTKVATNADRDYLHVHILSTHLIPKKVVVEVEQAIKDQLFHRTRIQIKLVESYQLSEQYTPENLMQEYYDSILFEIKHRSVVEHNMLANADYRFEGEDTLIIQFSDSIVAQEKSASIIAFLSEIFKERCHVPVRVEVSYRKAKESRMQEDNALRLQQEINAIVEENAAKHKEVREEKEAQRAERKAAKEERAKQFAAKKTEFYRSPKKSDDPNLIYGRDFEGDAIELSQVVGEMGEIIFRGKVLSTETREIRNEKTIFSFAVTDFTDSIMVKMFLRNEQVPEILGEIHAGAFLKIRGVTNIDRCDN